ncbi:sulfite exporter TauE/SafE family protein [Desulfosporosinus sp. Sb-LF]|uniref:sulfite exporter TauE/SafE family protein n=1 Tax=Desulfosporosinus sp. Sb-LF TaxID=2560027 RepID=UPI00107F7402|nr:sulfite exporter TauE/SafE family protein [Desulfosporosinus sp. Sb-LF]TGE31112.1 sulfite exporter TauE/SafE family protein [Desulfosporosinus sp. Sb-LF]
MTENWIIISFIGVFLASTFQAITGFGIAVMLVPLFLHFHPVQISAVYGLVMTAVSCFLMTAATKQYVRLDLIKNMFVASIPGIFLGLLIIQVGNEVFLKKSIGVITLISAVALLFDLKKPLKEEKWAALVIGLISGALSSSFGMPGPPVTLFGVNQGYEKNVFRASLSTYFFLVSLASLALIQIRFHYHASLYLGSFRYIVPLLAGFLIGNNLFKFIPTVLIYKAALILTAAIGCSILI